MPKLEDAINRSCFAPSAESYVSGYRKNKIFGIAKEFGFLVDSVMNECFHPDLNKKIEVSECGAILGLNPLDRVKISQSKIDTLNLFGESEIISTPETILIDLQEEDDKIIDLLKDAEKLLTEGPVIVKPNRGSLNKGVYVCNEIEELVKTTLGLLSDRSNKDKRVIIQKFIEGDEFRLVTLFGNLEVVVENTNMYEPNFDLLVDYDFQNIAKHVYEVGGLNFCGTDIIRNDGNFYILETNDLPNLAYINEYIPGFDESIYRKIFERILSI